MNEEKYFLNDEYNSVNEHAEFDLDDFDLDNDEDIKNLYWYVHGLQQKLAYITTCYDFTKQFAEKEENQHREFKRF